MQVGLGVILESENSSEGIVKIMEHMNKYVPNGSSNQPVPIISAGDQLTCEREINAQEYRRDCDPAERWAGMLPEIADFHALANFYEVGTDRPTQSHIYIPGLIKRSVPHAHNSNYEPVILMSYS